MCLLHRASHHRSTGVPAVPASVWTWTGCYVGGHVGGGWGHKSWRDVTLGGAEFASHGVTGWLGGFQIGCDYQAGAWVYGVEAQAGWAGLFGDSPDLSADLLRPLPFTRASMPSAP